MTRAELTTKLQQEIKGLSSRFNSDDYNNAIDHAQRDTGWTMPVSTDFRETWMIARAKRHLWSFLLSEQAHKFQYKQVKLNQRFDHYYKLLHDADIEFNAAIEENPHEFANVEAYEMFGVKIDAGFRRQRDTGRDLTYDDDTEVIVTPS